MDKATRLHYLEVMGITVWEARQSPFAMNRVAKSELASGPIADRAPKPCLSEVIGDAKPEIFRADIASVDETVVVRPISSPLPHQTIAPAHAGVYDWTTLEQQVSICRKCPLCETRSQTVFGVGDHHASWMLIGEAPGQDEDLQGQPFVGKAGQLLNEMLRAIGLKREQVYIANMLKCRPPRNRDPQADEITACHPYLMQQIALLQPRLILAVGRIAAQNLLQTTKSLSLLRGTLHQFANIPLAVVHHPAYLLRSPLEKAKAWEDLQFALSIHQKLEK